jgi:hypothetical protein
MPSGAASSRKPHEQEFEINMKFLDNLLDQHRTSFWPWIVLVAILTAIGAAGCLAGRAAQNAIDGQPAGLRGAVEIRGGGAARAAAP